MGNPGKNPWWFAGIVPIYNYGNCSSDIWKFAQKFCFVLFIFPEDIALIIKNSCKIEHIFVPGGWM
jgi:hypothetical protein